MTETNHYESISTDALINALQLARQQAEAYKADMELLLDKVISTDAYQLSRDMRDVNIAVIDHLTAEIKRRAEAEFAATGDKKLHPAVTIKLFTKTRYDVDTALNWCREHMPAGLTLNRKLFEDHAKAVAKTLPIYFVEICQEPQVQIASDLSKYQAVDEAKEHDGVIE